MSRTQSVAPREVGLLGSIVWKLFRLIGCVLLSWCVAVMIAIVMLMYVGQQQGLAYVHKLWQAQMIITFHIVDGAGFFPSFIYQALALTKMTIYLQVIIMITIVVMMRFFLALLFFPTFIALGIVGLIDGLVQRDLRRFSGRRESALRYHFARNVLFRCITWSWFFYLVLPFVLQPEKILLPFAILFSVMMASAAKRFKKYV